MKQSILKPKKDAKKKKSKTKLNIQDEPITKIKNEIFRKLCERNNSSKGRLKTINYEISNHKMKSDYKTPRSTSNFKDSRNMNSNIKSQFSQKKDISNPLKTKSKKIFRLPYNPRNYKAYPNLIGGILHQVNYYNINNNNNYNDYLRYKPIDDIFNEQSSISPKREKENNNNSPNISFNSENQNEDKNNLQYNNNQKLKIVDDINDNNDYNDNTNDNIYNNYNIENEMKVNPENIKNRKSSEIIVNNGKTISPIISSVSSYNNKKDYNDKNDINDIIGKYVDNNPSKNDDINEENNNKMNEKNIKNLNLKYKNKKKHLTPSYFNTETNRKEEKRSSRDEAFKRKINSFKIVKTNQLLVNKDYDKLKKNIKLKESPQDIFSIYNKPKKENKENKKKYFDNLKKIKCNDITIYTKSLKTNKSNPKLNYKDIEGQLNFDNEDQLFYYVKKKMQEEKDLEYTNDKPIYNYFILTKKFHGRVLYEIGLGNDINYINSILEKENVEIEHEPVSFIKKSELNQLKRNNYKKNNNEEIERLNKENEELKKKIDLNKGDKDSNLVNKLLKEINKLKEKNKNLENDLYNKQYIINQYDEKIQNYNKILDDNKILQDDKEKLTKYIYELQAYDEKLILEYQKLKQQLELEKQNNNDNNNNNNKQKKYFSNNELSMNTNDFFDIIDRRIYHKRKKRDYNNYGTYGENNNEEENEEEYEEEKGDENENEEEYDENKDKKKVKFSEEKDEDDKAKREERMKRAMKRVNNRRKMDKEWAEKNQFKKSNKIQGMAGELENKLKYVEGRSFAD